MAIGIRYEIPGQTVADASYLGGLGGYFSRQQALAMQAQQLAQQDSHFRQNLAADLYRQQQAQLANQASQVFQANRQMAFWDQQRQANREDLNLRRDWQLADQKQQHDWRVGDAATAFGNAKTLAEAGRDFQAEQWQKQQDALWSRQSIDATEQAIDSQIKQVANNMDLVQPGDMDDFRKFYNSWNAIRSNRVIQSNPKAYGEALQNFANDFSKSGVLGRMKPRLNTAEQFKQETFTQPGVGIVGRDRSGAWRQIAPEPDPVGDFVNKNLKNYQNPETGDVDFDRALEDAQKYLIARDQWRMREQGVMPTAPIVPQPATPGQQPPQVAPSQPLPSEPPPMVPPPAMPTVPVSNTPKEPSSVGLQRLNDPRQALAAVREIQAKADGFVGIPDPKLLTDDQVYEQLNSPASKRIMAESGIVNPTQPPPSAPPVIDATPRGEAMLREMLKQNPAGVMIIDSRDGKRKFISAAMLQ